METASRQHENRLPMTCREAVCMNLKAALGTAYYPQFRIRYESPYW